MKSQVGKSARIGHIKSRRNNMAGKQVTELDALPSFTDTSLVPVHNAQV